MKFIAEYYLGMTNTIAAEVIEAEDLQAAGEFAEGRATDYKHLVNIETIKD